MDSPLRVYDAARTLGVHRSRITHCGAVSLTVHRRGTRGRQDYQGASTMRSGAPSPARRAICHISTAHLANDSRVFWRECSGLASLGYRVTLLARASQDYTRNGVHVVGLRTYGSRLQRMTIGVLRALRQALSTRADIYHIHDPELIPALVLLRALGKPVVYDAHEWLTGQVTSKAYLPRGTRSLAVLFARVLELCAGRFANAIVTVSRQCARPFPVSKTWIVSNYQGRSELVASID